MRNRTVSTMLLAAVALIVWADAASAFYAPRLGRWLSRDPIEEKGGLNLYGYVQNRPSDMVDPQGTDAGGIDTWYPAARGCDAMLKSLCRKYKCAACGCDCMGRAERLANRYKNKLDWWLNEHRGYVDCDVFAPAIMSFGLGDSCFRVEQMSYVVEPLGVLVFGHTYVGLFHICNKTRNPDLILDPWHFGTWHGRDNLVDYEAECHWPGTLQ